MTNAKAIYVLTTQEGTTEDFTTIGALNKFAGIRATKAAIEAGQFPEVTIKQATTEEPTLDLDDQEPTPDVSDGHLSVYDDASDNPTLSELVDASDNVEVILVGDAPTQLVVEPNEDEGVDAEGASEATKAQEVLTNEATPTEDSQVEDTEESDTEVLTNKDSVEDTEQLDYPEVGHFADVKDIKKYIKGLSYEELAEWCELEGAEYKAHDNQSITRMRMAMAINALHFPNTAAKGGGSSKKKAKYADYSLEDLAQLAIDNDIEVKDSKGDPRIERMYLIMALKAAGLVPA